MYYVFLIHAIFVFWLFIDGYAQKVGIIPWAIGALLLGPIILPHYITKRKLKDGMSREGGNRQHLFKVIALLWSIILVAVSIWGGKTYTNTINAEPLEYQLAVINKKDSVQKNDAIIDRFRSLLEQLSQKYIEDPQKITNMSVIVRDQMKAKGIDESLVNIMEGMNQLLWPLEFEKRRYAEYAYAYVSLRNKGFTHRESIDRLQYIINGY